MASCMETRVGNEEEAPVWAEENKALVRRFLEAQATSDLETLDELLAPDFVDHTLLPGQDPSRQGYLRGYRGGSRRTLRHRHHHRVPGNRRRRHRDNAPHSAQHPRPRALLGMEPTGKEWKLTHIDMHRISRGKIVEA